MKNVTVAQVAQAALGVLDRRGWMQRPGGGSSGPTCVGLAIVEACRELGVPRMTWDVCECLARQIDERSRSATSTVVTWNDDPSTTEEDVRLGLKRLAEL